VQLRTPVTLDSPVVIVQEENIVAVTIHLYTVSLGDLMTWHYSVIAGDIIGARCTFQHQRVR
jgi:hypothetical protein